MTSNLRLTVSCELDAGPIIHQDVAHRDTVDDFVRLGREVERRVLARTVRLHLEDRILVEGHRTVVFEWPSRPPARSPALWRRASGR